MRLATVIVMVKVKLKLSKILGYSHLLPARVVGCSYCRSIVLGWLGVYMGFAR